MDELNPVERLNDFCAAQDQINQLEPDDEFLPQNMGLGLSTCRNILRAYNGEISFMSTLHEGSIFYFQMELQNAYDLSPQKQIVQVEQNVFRLWTMHDVEVQPSLMSFQQIDSIVNLEQ